MKTAVESLLKKLLINGCITLDDLEQAKEMEKKQIIEAGNRCALKQVIHNRRIDSMNLKQLEEFSQEENITFGEQYYKETYKTK